MNRNTFFGFNLKRGFTLGAVVLAAAAFLLPGQVSAQVTPVTMTTPNSIARVDVNSLMGMYQWSVNGQNQLNQQWFFYGVGNGAQQSIDSLSPAAYSQPTANSLNTSYSNGSFTINIGYVLTDGGFGQSDISESISISNNSANPLSLHFFQYSDFNLGGTPGGDTLVMDNQNAFQQKGLTAIAEGIIDPNADFFEAALTGGPGSTLFRLANIPGLTLSDSTTAAGDVTWAYQWNLSFNPGETKIILKDKQLQVTVIPEPSSLALIAAGVGLLGLMKRRK